MQQEYPDLEVIIVDAISSDRTLEIIGENFHVEFSKNSSRYAMINTGIAKAKSEYVAILYPGDTYLSSDVLLHLGELAHLHAGPDMIFGGCLRRMRGADPTALVASLEADLLKKGIHPPSIQASIFKKSAFEKVGGMNDELIVKGNFDLFCRFQAQKECPIVQTHHILVDDDMSRRHTSVQWMIWEAFENFITIKKYFGIACALKWAFSQKPTFFLRYLSLRLKESFQKR